MRSIASALQRIDLSVWMAVISRVVSSCVVSGVGGEGSAQLQAAARRKARRGIRKTTRNCYLNKNQNNYLVVNTFYQKLRVT